MNQKTFEELINDSRLLNKDTLSELEQLIKEYPFCQSFQLLYTKNLYQEKHIRYHQQLKLAAAIVCDRSRLKHYIEDTAVTRNVSSENLNSDQINSNDVKRKKEKEISKKTEQTDLLKIIQESENLNNLNDELPLQSSGDLAQISEPPIIIQSQVDNKQDSLMVDEDVNDESLLLSTHGAKISREEKKRAIIELINKRFDERTKLKENEELKIPVVDSTSADKNEDRSLISLNVTDKLAEVKNDTIEYANDIILDPLSTIDLSLPHVRDNKKVEDLENVSENDNSENAKEQSSSSDKTDKPSSKDLIERFIREAPRISRPKKGFYNPVNLAARSLEENEDFYTETYASICLKQGNAAKALKIYEKLSLKIPEKSSYFAGLIEKIKKEQNI